MNTIKNLFTQTLLRQNLSGTPPIWLMRQAGRYHSHYQSLRKQYSFEQICKFPEVSVEAAMGPIQDFDFDAAILFSDILFTLEAMGVGLKFDPAPRLEFLLRTKSDVKKYNREVDSSFFKFQTQALHELSSRLAESKGLIGFVGGALTLYLFAVEGTAKSPTESWKTGLSDGRYAEFMDRLLPVLTTNILAQAKAPIDCMAILDPALGLLSFDLFEKFYFPRLKRLIEAITKEKPNLPILYYAKDVFVEHWNLISELPVHGMGIDSSFDLPNHIKTFSSKFAIQGNFSQQLMLLENDQLISHLQSYFESIRELPEVQRAGWICGLGHGILPKTPEENVRTFVRMARDIFK